MPDLSIDQWWCNLCNPAGRNPFTYLDNGYWKCACNDPPLSVIHDATPATKPPIPSVWTNNPFRG